MLQIWDEMHCIILLAFVSDYLQKNVLRLQKCNTNYALLPIETYLGIEEWNGIWKKNLVWNGIWNGKFLLWNRNGTGRKLLV